MRNSTGLRLLICWCWFNGRRGLPGGYRPQTRVFKHILYTRQSKCLHSICVCELLQTRVSFACWVSMVGSLLVGSTVGGSAGAGSPAFTFRRIGDCQVDTGPKPESLSLSLYFQYSCIPSVTTNTLFAWAAGPQTHTPTPNSHSDW